MMTTQTTTKRSFTDEFKREAVSLLASSGRPLTQMAIELGIQPSMLRKRQPIPALLFRVQVGLVWDGLKFHGNSASSALLRWPFAMRSITAAI